MNHKFDEKEIYKLDNPQKNLKADPLKNMEPSGSQKGSSAAGNWRGIGYFSVPSGRYTGTDSAIYALDISPEMLDGSDEKNFDVGVSNIRAIQTEEYEQEPDDFSIDFILLSNVTHQVKDKFRMFNEITRMLKCGGWLSMIEWEKRQGAYGPPLEERISYEEVADLLAQKGYYDISKHIISENFYGLKARKSLLELIDKKIEPAHKLSD